MTIFEISLFGYTLAPSWYGLMYALGFLGGYAVLKYRKAYSESIIDDIVLAMFLGVLLGGRIGYVVFYDLGYFLSNPSEILQPWKGGMSFHGGLIGATIAMYILARMRQISFLTLTDNVAILIGIGLGLGRIGNYINGELIGYAGYTGPFAMVIEGISYFPSPLLEAFLEGPLLMFILWRYAKISRFPGAVGCMFLIVYAIFRFGVEFVRLPDPQIGYLLGSQWLTMGHVLSIFMGGIGILIFWLLKGKNISRV